MKHVDLFRIFSIHFREKSLHKLIMSCMSSMFLLPLRVRFDDDDGMRAQKPLYEETDDDSDT